MADLTIVVSEEHKDKPQEEMSELLDKEVENFSAFMATIGDWKTVGPLNSAERALIKTYLVQKLTGKLDKD
jgi:hypothetical protein